MIDENHQLPAAAVDAIWRLTNHPGTLTAEWYEGIVQSGAGEMTPLHYTELVGVVSQANCIDRFADALSIPRAALPEPTEGQPTQLVPGEAALRNHWFRRLRAQAQCVPVAEMGNLAADRNSLTRM